MALGPSGALANDAPVPVGSSVTLLGTSLASARSVQVGGAAAALTSTTDTQVVFSVPPLGDPTQQGQPQSILLNFDQTQLTVGELRVFGMPSATTVKAGPGGTGVVAGGQAYVYGSGFSGRLDENVVTVGAAPGVQAQVLVVLESQLLVALPSATPNGVQSFTVQIAPEGGDPSLFAPLNASVSAVVWKPIAPFSVVPPQAFSGESVRLVAPQDNLYASYDDPQFTNANASTAVAYQASAAAGSTGQAQTTGSDGSGSTSGAASSGTTTGGTTSSTGLPSNSNNVGGGFGVVPDAGVLNASDPYPSDGTSGGLLSVDLASLPVTHANSKMFIELDAVDTQVVPWQRVSDGALLVTVPTAAAGMHSLAIGDPSGPSPSAALQVLPGHLSSPAMDCRPPDDYVPSGGLVPRALRSDQVAGDVIVFGTTDAEPTTLNYAAIHPGGSLGTAWSVPYDAPPTVVSAGRGTLFVNVTYDGSSYLHATPIDAPFADIVTIPSGTPVSAIEPDFDTPSPWTLSNDTSQTPASISATIWSADSSISATGYDLSQLNPDSSCGVSASSMEKVHRIADATSSLERATLAYLCASGVEVAVSQLFESTPPGVGIVPSALDAVTEPDGGLLPDAGLLVAQVTNFGSLDVLGGNPGFVVSQGLALAFGTGAFVLDANAGTAGQPESAAFGDGGPFAFDLSISAAALSPDGLQAAVAGARGPTSEPIVRLYDRRVPSTGETPTWSLQGEFVLPARSTPTAITYDASGSQVVVLVTSTDATSAAVQTGYCSLH